MNAQKYFEQHAEELIARFAGKNVALFFRGFVPTNVRWLAQREDAILPANKVLNADGTINIAKIDASKRKLVQSLMMQEEGVTVGIYEEMLAILQNVQDPKAMFDAEFIVVDNNAFPAYVPSCIPAEDAEVLYKAYEAEKTEFGPEAEVLSHYYAAVRMLNDRCYVALLNRHKGENIRSIDFYQKKQAAFTDTAATLPNDVSPLVLADRFFCGEMDGPLVLPVEREQNAKNNTYDVLAFAAEQCGATFALNCASHKEQVEPETVNRYRAILKQYWGTNADFRMLDFYKDPAAGTETMQISQGEIISTIVKQCELALDGYQDYSNVFLTAPTGAGKSAFYQVSGIYLAQVHQAVTLVITPLIALMKDQVDGMENRGVSCSTFLNSSVTREEREERLNAIHKGEKSILYIAPEMLLTTSLETLLGGRKLGLLVVDEAHTVTSWGRDFRADYWFLGDYLERQRKNGLHFPVLCLTATAVFGGKDDVVQDTISTLGLNQPILYLGRVRRDNIDFDIHPLIKQTNESRDEFKVNHVGEKIAEYVDAGKKTLVYCPFRSTVRDIFHAVPLPQREKVRCYYGTEMGKAEKEEAQKAFNENRAVVMVCTKAFGMGVDVPDIVQVYHYAPTGNLADYVQEIGRCARDKKLQGTAVEEYLPGDLSQLKRLHGMGELRQYQLREMLRKLYGMYSQKKHRNLLVSPDVFSYLFNSGEVENRVKTGLLLLAKDLEEAYGFPVLVVRPKAMFTTCYANVPEEIEEEFLSKYGDFVRNLYDNTVTVNRSFTPLASDVVVRNSGNIYEIRMGDLWEKHFSDMTFGMFKAKFFKGELFEQDGTNRISVRVKTQIHYGQDFETTRNKLRQYMEAVAQVFDAYRKGVQEVDANGRENVCKMFTVEDFCRDVQKQLGNEVLNKDFAKALLELFVMDVQADPTKREGDRMKFIQAKHNGNQIGLKYRVTNGNYFSMANWMDQQLVNCAPNREETEYMGYIPATIGGKQNPVMRLLAVLEIFGLASYEVRGGQNLEIFVRVNDPQKIRSLSESRSYKNMQLVEIHRRHADAEEMMLSFLTKDLTSKQRWDLVEDYFLGHDEVVGKVLGLEDQN